MKNKENIRKITFGKFDNEEDSYENKEHSEKEKPKIHKDKKPSLAKVQSRLI